MSEFTQLFRVGQIASTKGLKGEVKVFPTTDDKLRFKDLKEVLLEGENPGDESGMTTLKIETVSFFKQFAVLKFKGLDRIEDIEVYRGRNLFIKREQAVPLSENEYFIADLIGMNVFSDDEKAVGILTDVIQTGANDVYTVTTNDGKELLFPAIKECIKKINPNERTIIVHIMEGLI